MSQTKVHQMAKKPANSGRPWNPSGNSLLKQLARGNTPTRVIGIKMGRSPAAVQTQASKIGQSLNPHNRSPYGTKKK